jgi:Fe-S-cluster containining protein
MNTQHLQLIEKAKLERERIRKQFAKLKKLKAKDVDVTFHSGHDDFFQKNNCLTCANCCKTTSPIFRDVDIRRISKQLKLKEVNFIKQYLKLDEDGDYVLQHSPCVFLEPSDNTCTIYEFRPLACSEYPHTNRKNMIQILNLTARNSEVCPAVASIVLKMINPRQ